jgi:hypothetical protein
MAPRKPAPPAETAPVEQAPAEEVPAVVEDRRTLATKAADAVAGLDDYTYAELEHDGQRHVAWRSRNGEVHVENRGA